MSFRPEKPEYIVIFYIIAAAVGGFPGLPLANAIFIDEMTVYNNDMLEKKRDNLTEEIMKLAGIVDSYERKSRDA